MTTLPLQQILATLPSGVQAPAITVDDLERYIRERYINNRLEKERKEMHARRQHLYSDGGIPYIDRLIEQVFVDKDVQDKRKAWARIARFNNAIKRIVNELSTVYQEPARREVTGDDERYQLLQRACRQHEQFRRVNRFLNLHRSLFVGFRVRDLPGVRKEPVIDIATPDVVSAITHPNDPTALVALMFSVSYATALRTRQTPAFQIWTDHEKFQLTADGVLIPSSYEVHGFPRMPWVAVSLEPPLGGYWPGDAGEDLVSAQMAIWFANVSLLKETKSATKVPVVQGDTTDEARGQMLDTEGGIELGEGTAISTLDNSMDLGMFRATADHVLESTANNYGMSLASLKHQGVQSAEARELMRTPVKELRREQMVALREFEREFVEVQAMVISRDMPELAFDTAGWHVEFSSVKTPLGEKEALEVFEAERRLLLTNTVQYLVEKLDITEAEAWQKLEENVVVELARNVLMRPLQAVSGSAGAQPPPAPGQPPQADQQGGQQVPGDAPAKEAAA